MTANGGLALDGVSGFRIGCGCDADAAWADALLAARILAVDPAGLGGVVVRARPGVLRDRWQAIVRDMLPREAPLRRLPVHADDDRVLGGLDIAATLAAGRPIASRGLLAEADGGVVIIAGAERLDAAAAARLTGTMDRGWVCVERDGFGHAHATRFGLIAYDESVEDDQRIVSGLRERLALHIDLDGVGHAASAARGRGDGLPVDGEASRAAVAEAREILTDVVAGDDLIEAICATAVALGVTSVRVSILALRAACASAALAGRRLATHEDGEIAVRLVLLARATHWPSVDAEDAPADEATAADGEADAPPASPPEMRDEPVTDDDDHEVAAIDQSMLKDVLISAVMASLPPGVLKSMETKVSALAAPKSQGRSGQATDSALRGRPVGVRSGLPRGGARISILASLRAAAPWQTIRQREGAAHRRGTAARRIEVRAADLRVKRFKSRSETTTIFLVDASGSSALHRLGEAKGAVELLLARCYSRRDRVALVAFRGKTAELVLPPTHALARAKRSLAGLVGGGGTPLAIGIDAGLDIAENARRRGERPTLVLLTDGRANVTRDGRGGRPAATEDARAAARRVRISGTPAILIDTSPRPSRDAAELAGELGAIYAPLPHADAGGLLQAVNAARA
ncbi:MAG: magnesium chelatase subunit D [Hyphomicrobiaceae bacterium]|nr:magnesium chelatase subunit D [Hyphomicrobiaceae bacterium]